MPLPIGVSYGRVTWRAVQAVADSSGDPDELPDSRPVSGTVTFTPSATVMLATEAAPPVTVFASPISFEMASDGVLRDAEGHDGVWLVATDSPGLTPVGWTWTVSYRLTAPGLSRGSFAFQLPTNTVVDLTKVSPVGASGGVQITQGPPGPPGSPYPMALHGSDADYPRPDVAGPVVWMGTVAPNNLDVAQGDVFDNLLGGGGGAGGGSGLVALDSDGVPYFDPNGVPGGGLALQTDTDGVLYF